MTTTTNCTTITQYTQVLSQPGETFCYRLVDLCDACRATQPNCSKMGRVYNARCQICGATDTPPEPVASSWDAELIALRDEIHAEGGCTLREAAEMARNSIGALAEFAQEWDNWSDTLLAWAYAPAFMEDTRDAELAASCDCYGLGIEQAACVEAGRCVQQHPTPPAAAPRTGRQRAADKAAYLLSTGIRPVRARDGWLIPSNTRNTVVHYVSDTQGCSCEGARHHGYCWHQEAAKQIDIAPALLAA